MQIRTYVGVDVGEVCELFGYPLANVTRWRNRARNLAVAFRSADVGYANAATPPGQ
jgi:hypothetical protein